MSRKILSLFLVFILLFSSIGFSQDYISMSKSYSHSTKDLFDIVQKMVQENSDILELEILGYSYDKRPIYVVRFSHDRDFDYINKMHILVEGGNHAREHLNPSIIVKTLSDYIKNYRVFGDVYTLSKEFVFHFIVSLNPDGNDIAKFGPTVIKDKSLYNFYINNVKGDYKRLKANVRGVDLNRNFENYTLNRTTGLYSSDATTPKKTSLMNIVPSLEFFGGTMGSEVETQIAQHYYLRYDFRAFISYHSQGRVVYGDTVRFGPEVDKISKEFMSVIRSTTSYAFAPPGPTVDPNPWGFAGRFVNSHMNKPFLTVETTNKVPPTQEHYNTEYSKYNLYHVPINIAKKAKEVGYFDFKLYKNGVYVRDVISEAHAKGLAARDGFVYREYKGKPFLSLADYDTLVRYKLY